VESILLSLAIGAAAFVSGLVGLVLLRHLPERHSVEKSRDMIGAVIGLVTLLLALVLGTVVGSSYGFYATQKAEVETLATRAVQLDLALAEYGPDTDPLRKQLKAGMVGAYNLFWGPNRISDSHTPNLKAAAALPNLRSIAEFLANLNPQTQQQRIYAGNAALDASIIENLRLGILLQLASPVSWPLVGVVVIWSVFLFCGFGVLSRPNATTIVALAFGSFAVASAIFLILELSQPYTGLFRIPPGALEQAIDALGR
jgi:hypothetical protein